MTEGKSIINANLTPLPDKVGVDGLEDKWRAVWDEDGTYKFRNTRDRKAVYSIDTPPPTVSGSLHVGHVFSYTHTDVIARYKRMRCTGCWNSIFPAWLRRRQWSGCR